MYLIQYGDHIIWKRNHLSTGDAARHRRQLNQAVRESLRDLSVQMSLLIHRIGRTSTSRALTCSALTASTVTARSARARWRDTPGSIPPP